MADAGGLQISVQTKWLAHDPVCPDTALFTCTSGKQETGFYGAMVCHFGVSQLNLGQLGQTHRYFCLEVWEPAISCWDV